MLISVEMQARPCSHALGNWRAQNPQDAARIGNARLNVRAKLHYAIDRNFSK
jgi:hypothetical protein